MRKAMLFAMLVFALALSANAQTKISGKATCAKPDTSYSVDVGDKPGHMLTMSKNSCTDTEPLEIAGLKAKEGLSASTGDVNGSTGHESGYHTETMDNGDKFTARWTSTGKMNKDGTGTFEGKWRFLSGTGKLKGIQGGGTSKGTIAADGSGAVDIEGEYTLPEAKATPEKKSS